MHWNFYQNIVSPHQSTLLRSLARIPGQVVRLFVERLHDPMREAMGWERPQLNAVEVQVLSSREEASAAVRESPFDTVHIFSGLTAYPLVSVAFHEAKRMKRLLGVMAESGSGSGVAGALRRIKAWQDAMRYRNDVGFLLAMGNLGVKWYCDAGFRIERVFPFGYFVENYTVTESALPSREKGSIVRLIYLGRLLPTKGPDILFQALSHLRRSDWSLDIVGDGSELARCRRIAEKQTNCSRVTFHGSLPHQEAISLLSRADVLVVPSRWDGWGAVVNEALQNGVRVICTSHCGAADLIIRPAHGRVVDPGSTRSLIRAISQCLNEGPTSYQQRLSIKSWAKCISGENAASYLRDLVDHVKGYRARPSPPWMTDRNS